MKRSPIRVTLVASADAQVSPLSGLYETFHAFPLLTSFEPDLPAQPFEVEIVAADAGCTHGASGLPLGASRTCEEVQHTDIAIVPLMTLDGAEWQPGRYPGVVEWLRRMHRQGTTLCSACTGVLLLAETGLLDGGEATIHWAFAPTFRRNFPQVRLRTGAALVTSGTRDEFTMTGGVMSWHDLALFLIARTVGRSAAQAAARMLMLQWHSDGQAPYVGFAPSLDHGDTLVRELQQWLHTHYMVPNPVEEMLGRSQLPIRTLERRFRRATGSSPLAYVQNVRIAEAKRRLERSDVAVETIARAVGYENTAFFRRVFKRSTRITPAAYRRTLQICPLP